MRAYIVQRDKTIEPFDEPARDCLVRNEPLSELQKRTLLELRLEPRWISSPDEIQDTEPYILIHDNLYFTRELLNEFIEKSKTVGESTVCALKPGLLTLRSIVATQELNISEDFIEYNLYYVCKRQKHQAYQRVVIDPQYSTISVVLPKQVFGVSEYLVPLTEYFIIQIDHWVNLWAANISTLLSDGAKLHKSKVRLLCAILKARSLNKYNIMAQLNKVGKKCDIHPTARIEASTIGHHVQIGAGAVVLNSVIDDSVFIEKNVVIDSSIIGTGSRVSQAEIAYSVLYPGSSVACFLLTCLIGKNALTAVGADFTDFRFDGSHVFVMKNDVLVNTQNEILGVCLGHGVFIGSGCLVAPGRMIPGGVRIVVEENRTIRGCTPDKNIPGFRLIRKDGSVPAKNNREIHLI